MFKTTVSSTPFTTDIANSYFGNITGSKYGNDNSFLATMRALLAPRMKENDKVWLGFSSSRYTASDVANASIDSVVRSIVNCSGVNLDNTTGTVLIHSFNADQESNLANMRAVEAKFETLYKGYKRIERIGAFYQQSFKVDCFINTEKKNAVVFVDSLNIKKLHYLQVSILAIMPWFFNPKDGATEDELALLYSLRETSSDNYMACLAKLAEKYDFRTVRIKQMLKGFESKFERMEMERVKNSILSYNNQITTLNQQIGDKLRAKNDLCIRLLGLEQKVNSVGEESEIMDYFLCNNRLYLESVSDCDMNFCVKDYLSYFDKEIAERAINNKRSFVYYRDVRNMPHEKMEKLMREIFVSENPRLRIRFCAAYNFSLNGNVNALTGHRFDADFAEYMPNPHIDRYACMGNYQRTINDLLKNNDYIAALEQSIASCKSLNWGDSTVMQEFMDTMYGTNSKNRRCIELPNGKVVNPEEAVAWLEEQEKVNEQKTEEA